jgi:hypothetical protein
MLKTIKKTIVGMITSYGSPDRTSPAAPAAILGFWPCGRLEPERLPRHSDPCAASLREVARGKTPRRKRLLQRPAF